MLLHFGVLHLAMNGLWYWELGKRIELRQGPWLLLGLTLLFSLVSNLAQHSTSGPSLFGGLSGVLYGLLGHVWLYQWLAPNPYFNLPKGVLVMMLIWLVICLTGVVGQQLRPDRQCRPRRRAAHRMPDRALGRGAGPA